MDARDARIRALEDVLEEVAREVESARAALCANELLVRLENIGRAVAAARSGQEPESRSRNSASARRR